jgi:hypothetical protein
MLCIVEEPENIGTYGKFAILTYMLEGLRVSYFPVFPTLYAAIYEESIKALASPIPAGISTIIKVLSLIIIRM